MIQIKGQYRLEDFKKARQLHARQRSASYGTRVFLAALGVLFYGSWIVLVRLGRLQWPAMLAPLALLLVCLLYQYGYKPYMLGQTFKKRKDLSAPFEMDLSNAGLSVGSPKGSAMTPVTIS